MTLWALLPFIFCDLKQMLFVASKIWFLGLKLRLVIGYNLYVQTKEGNISMIISGCSYHPEALNIRLQCLVPLNKMVELNTSIISSWRKQRPCAKMLAFHLPSGKMRWKQLCISIIANLCVILTGHLLYLNGMVRHLMCHTSRFLGVWHMYSYPKRIVRISYQLRPKKQPLLVMRKVPKDTDSGLLSTDE